MGWIGLTSDALAALPDVEMKEETEDLRFRQEEAIKKAVMS
jgi:hypothetical protein